MNCFFMAWLILHQWARPFITRALNITEFISVGTALISVNLLQLISLIGGNTRLGFIYLFGAVQVIAMIAVIGGILRYLYLDVIGHKFDRQRKEWNDDFDEVEDIDDDDDASSSSSASQSPTSAKSKQHGTFEAVSSASTTNGRLPSIAKLPHPDPLAPKAVRATNTSTPPKQTPAKGAHLLQPQVSEELDTFRSASTPTDPLLSA